MNSRFDAYWRTCEKEGSQGYELKRKSAKRRELRFSPEALRRMEKKPWERQLTLQFCNFFRRGWIRRHGHLQPELWRHNGLLSTGQGQGWRKTQSVSSKSLKGTRTPAVSLGAKANSFES